MLTKHKSSLLFFTLFILSAAASEGASLNYLQKDSGAHPILYNRSDISRVTRKSPELEKIPVFIIKYGILLDTAVEMLDNYPLYEFIDQWMGVKYQYGGKDENGIDCSAFTGRLFRDLYNVTLPRTSLEQFENSEPVETENLKEGDLLFFNTSGKSISHVGIYLGNGKFVHASTQKGVTIDALNWPYYQKTFIGAGRPYISSN